MSASASLESASENRPCPRGPVRDALPAEPRRRAALGSRHSAGVRRRFWRRKEAGAGRRQARAQASGGDRHRRIETTLAMRGSEHRKAGAGHNHAIFAGYASLWPSHATARSDSRGKSAGRSPLPLPKRLAYPVKIASEPSIRKPQHGIGRKGWTGKTRALESLRAETKRRGLDWGGWTARLGRQGWTQRPPGQRVLPVAFSQTRTGRRMGDDRDKFRSARVLSRKREQAAGEAACSRTSETRRTSVSLKHTLHGQLSFVKNILRKDFSPVPFA